MLRVSTVLIIVSAIFFNACHSEAPTTDVDKAAAQFFERMKEAKLDLIYDDSAAMFKEQNPRVTLLESLRTLAEMGRIAAWTRISMTIEQEGKYRVVKPVYYIKTDHLIAEVMLKFIEEDSEWKFMGILIKHRR